jgi:mannose-6-phosphate isomerase-like protein (cupin superfamily)
MAQLIPHPTVVQAVGNKPKLIEEYVGRVNNREARLSIARMKSPAGWMEPGQTPEFDEYTIVLAGTLRVEARDAEGRHSFIDVHAGQAVLAKGGEWVRYSSPGPEGAEYVAVCLPAFSPTTVNRDQV